MLTVREQPLAYDFTASLMPWQYQHLPGMLLLAERGDGGMCHVDTQSPLSSHLLLFRLTAVHGHGVNAHAGVLA